MIDHTLDHTLDLSLFRAARGIADRVYELLAERDGSTEAGARKSLWLQDWRHTEPNPFYSQTSSGLMLELYYGSPNRLWTPWGLWNFGGSSISHEDGFAPIVTALCEEFGGAVHRPEVVTSVGCFGPIYTLSKFGPAPLPAAIEAPRSERRTYEDARAQWRALSAA